MLSDQIIGKKSQVFSMDYTWRDIALYALAVGAKENDLEYVYEKQLKALPTFGVVPCFSSYGVSPSLLGPADPTILAADFVEDRSGRHMGHELILHRPIAPLGGRLVFQTKIVGLYDRGPGKGAVIKQQVDVSDGAGNPVCTNIADMILLNAGGFGGEPMPGTTVKIPETAPDFELDDFIPANQHLLYRLTGDTNDVHVDPAASQREGVERPFMHGLCSFGYVCRMAAGVLVPHEPERFTRIAAQMRSILFPGCPIRLQIWKTGDGSALFRLVNMENGAAILDRGVLEWK